MNVTSTADPSSVSYTSGIADEKCVLEEEFHGASSLNLGAHHEHNAWWDDDDIDEDAGDTISNSAKITDKTERKSNRRWRVWKKKNSFSSTEKDSSPPLSPDGPITSLTVLDQEHPMRTDEWEFDVHLSPLFSREEHHLFPECFVGGNVNTSRGKRYRKRQVMQFARNGYVKVIQDEQLTSNNMDASFVGTLPTTIVDKSKRGQVQVGKWRIGHNGVVFDIPVTVYPKRKNGDDSVDQKMTILHYHADIHLNKFGERPRMFRGVITRDR
jgi:hypothetical protein